MAELLTTDTDLTTVANAIRTKTGKTGNLTFPTGFVSEISGIANYGADGAGAAHILAGKKAFVGNATVEGTIESKGSEIFHPSASDRTIPANKYLSGAQTIKGVSVSNLTAGNIKKGVTVTVGDGSVNVASVTGTYDPVYTQYGYVPFMFQAADALALGFSWDGSGWRISAGGAAARNFVVPCTINMSFYETDTSASASNVTFSPGTIYSIAPYSNVIAILGGGGINKTIYKVLSWTRV